VWTLILRGPFEKFVDSSYYSELGLCGGAVTVSFPKYLPWKAMYFLQRSTHFSKTCCRPLITSKFLALEFSFHGYFVICVHPSLPPSIHTYIHTYIRTLHGSIKFVMETIECGINYKDKTHTDKRSNNKIKTAKKRRNYGHTIFPKYCEGNSMVCCLHIYLTTFLMLLYFGLQYGSFTIRLHIVLYTLCYTSEYLEIHYDTYQMFQSVVLPMIY
jgi:hypothetical protein